MATTVRKCPLSQAKFYMFYSVNQFTFARRPAFTALNARGPAAGRFSGLDGMQLPQTATFPMAHPQPYGVFERLGKEGENGKKSHKHHGRDLDHPQTQL